MVEIISLPSEILQIFPPEASAGILTLINILRAIGIFFVIYFTLQIINIIMNIKRNKRIKRIEEKTISIENKINKILEKNKLKNKKII